MLIVYFWYDWKVVFQVKISRKCKVQVLQYHLLLDKQNAKKNLFFKAMIKLSIHKFAIICQIFIYQIFNYQR